MVSFDQNKINNSSHAPCFSVGSSWPMIVNNYMKVLSVSFQDAQNTFVTCDIVFQIPDKYCHYGRHSALEAPRF